MLYTIEPKLNKTFLKNALFMLLIMILPIGIFIPLKYIYFETQCNIVSYRGENFHVCGKDRKTIKTW